MNWFTKCSVILLLSALSACGGSSGSNVSPPPPGYTSPSTDYSAAVTHNSAKLVGSFSNPAGYPTTSWLEYGTTPAYGSKTLDTVYASAGPVNIAVNISLLQPGTIYHFRLATSNASGTWYGQDSTFTTLFPNDTGASTGNATNVYDTSATLTGSFANFAGNTTSQWFEYGLTTAYGSATLSTYYASPGTVNVATNISSLQPNNTYHFRLVTLSAGVTRYGSDNTFTTPVTVQIPATIYPLQAPPPQIAPRQIATDATNIYWTEVAYPLTTIGGSVKSMPIAGGAVTTLATGLNAPFGIAVDATSVYFTEEGGTLSKVALAGGGSGCTLNTTTVAGNIATVALSAGGTGYSVNEILNVAGGTGGQVLVTSVGAGGTVTGVRLNLAANPAAAGSGYTAAPAPGPGVATTSGGVQLLPLAGSGFTLNTTTTVAGNIATVALSAGGAGYFVNEILNVTGGTGGQVLVTSVGAGGAVTGVTLIASGTGYTAAPAPGPGVATTLPRLNNPQYIAVDASNVYFTEFGTWNAGYGIQNNDGTINKIPLVGGALPTVLASGLDGPKAIAIDATNIFWVEVANSVSGAGAVKSVPIAGSGAGCTLTTTTALGNITTVVLSAGGTGYSVNEILNVAGGTGGQALVTSVGAGGAVTGVTLIAAGTGYTTAAGVATTSGGVRLLSGLSGSQYIGIDAGSVYYWQEYGTLAKAAKAGGAPTVLVTGMTGTQPIAVDTTNVYWADTSFGSPLMKIPKSGGNVTVIATGAASPVSMVVDTTNIYWVEFDLATIFSNTNYSGKINRVQK